MRALTGSGAAPSRVPSGRSTSQRGHSRPARGTADRTRFPLERGLGRSGPSSRKRPVRC
ncbi:MAG: hypothetical protein AVDCRST_MAG40-1210 [uncultured Gemmatimonadaceae bacterium]|uniref:Uncharacterized protein n=1 Tax=uncultured Gemmatimonadaceae bacterium TaxID=246130 RepID=A0A6J4KU72_9BACT|nr:MAG: hypothetical protein AVDCRST_MAG40-1210 [uncultured Gemmatimonadaceae bacterium]